MKDHEWLQSQITDAQKDVQNWPEWMKRAATFDGTSRSGIETAHSPRKGTAHPPRKTDEGAEHRSSSKKAG